MTDATRDGEADAFAIFDERGLPPIDSVDVGIDASPNVNHSKWKKFDDVTRQDVMAACVELSLRGYNQEEIASRFGITQQTVHRYLAAMRQQWRRRKPDQLNSIIQKQLDAINALEREYWQAWRNSCTETVTVEQFDGDMGTSTKTTTKTSSGNSAFLEGVLKCGDMRMKVVGGYAPTRVSVSWQKELEQYGGDAQKLFSWLVASLTAERLNAAPSVNDESPKHTGQAARVIEGATVQAKPDRA